MSFSTEVCKALAALTASASLAISSPEKPRELCLLGWEAQSPGGRCPERLWARSAGAQPASGARGGTEMPSPLHSPWTGLFSPADDSDKSSPLSQLGWLRTLSTLSLFVSPSAIIPGCTLHSALLTWLRDLAVHPDTE